MSIVGDQARAGKGEALFSPTTSTTLVVGAALVLAVVWVTDDIDHTVLLTPLDARFRAGMIAAGVFFGVWVAAILRDEWRPWRGLRDLIPQGWAIVSKLIALVAAGGWCGSVLAERVTEWRAFHGLRAPAVQEVFAVTGFTHHRKGADRLDLVDPSDAQAISVSCWVEDCHPLRVGDRLLVMVETGRSGVRRAVFPAAVSERGSR